MMGKICIHYDDEVPRSMLHAVDVGSAFERKQQDKHSYEQISKCTNAYTLILTQFNTYLGLIFLLLVVAAETHTK